MRKVTREVVQAFLDGRSRTVRNTSTDGRTLWLHGNRIAWHHPASILGGVPGVFLTDAGWATRTTRDRLNGVLGLLGRQAGPVWLSFYSEGGDQHLGARGNQAWSRPFGWSGGEPEVVFVPLDPELSILNHPAGDYAPA